MLSDRLDFTFGPQAIIVFGADFDLLNIEILNIQGRLKALDYRVNTPDRKRLEADLDEVDETVVVHVGLGWPVQAILFRWIVELRHKRLSRGRLIVSTEAATIEQMGIEKKQSISAFHKLASENFVWIFAGDHHCQPSFKQAVLFVHGIGEQVADTSVKKLIESLTAEAVKRFQLESQQLKFSTEAFQIEGRKHTTTDFYEYYWAHENDNAKYADVVLWIVRLLFRRPHKQSKAVWIASWVILLIFLAALVAITVLSFDTGIVTALKDLPLISGLVVSAGGLVADLFVLRVIADAARYLDDRPRNVRLRNSIRSSGEVLLQSIIGDGYDRVVVVGHSLGSVIAYDIISHLWATKYWNDYPSRYWDWPEKIEHRLKHQQWTLNPLIASMDSLTQESSDDEIRRYQQLQLDYHWEARRMGNRWPVSDFVTVGSPLVHATWLLGPIIEMRGELLCKSPPLKPDGHERTGRLDTFVAQNDADRRAHAFRKQYSGQIICRVRSGKMVCSRTRAGRMFLAPLLSGYSVTQSPDRFVRRSGLASWMRRSS